MNQAAIFTAEWTARYDRTEGGHRGPLSRTWPQLFKKRRRYSPVEKRTAAATATAAATTAAAAAGAASANTTSIPTTTTVATRAITNTSYPPVKVTINSDTIHHVPISLDKISVNSSRHCKYHIINLPCILGAPNKVAIARRSSSIIPADSNGAGGVTTPQADLLASKSNYELISSGQHLEMGLHFSTAMATGVMMKRATHRAAEQARRDRMKTAMVDLAEFLLDGEVTFGSGTTCFVVMRGKDGEDGSEKVGGGGKQNGGSVPGEKKTVNKARLIEMALEKMKAQEKEIEMLRKEVEDLGVVGDRMDET